MRILHIRTSERAAIDAIDQWIGAQHAEAIDCEDAFAAVVTMLTRPQHTPDVAFLGLHGLEPEDAVLVGWLRETWPALKVVVVGDARHLGQRPGVTVCTDQAALQALLQSPDPPWAQKAGIPTTTTPRSAPTETLTAGGVTHSAGSLSAEELEALLREAPDAR